MIQAQQVLVGFAFAATLLAQQAPPAGSQAEPAGLETPWSIAPVLQEIGAHAGRLLNALDRIDTKAWVEKGASETYGEQVQSCKVQANALADGAKALARNPEQLSASIELFFRIQSLETMLGSVEEGLSKYQSPADAGALASLEAETGANRNRLQRYIVSLAGDREHQLQIMDQEAQRCRAVLTAPYSTGSKSGKKK
jgi:hypothetical protein